MKADKLGVLSALFASVCCITPLLLVLLGLGSLGVGAVLGRFHWWFLAAAFVLLTVAWRRYFHERRRCATEQCEVASGTPTRWTLLVASVVVATFAGLNVYTFAGQRQQTGARSANPSANAAEAVIPVEGMTCLTCELTIESGLKRLPGVQYADARVTDQTVSVRYDPAQISVNDMVETINKTGYRVRSPEGDSR